MAGQLAVVFDDGYASDDSLVRPVFDDYDVSACFAVVPAWFGRENHLDAETVRSLADDGHEIAAHGRYHRYLGRYPLASPTVPGDRRVAVGDRVFSDSVGGIRPGDTYELVTADHTETHTVVGTDAADDHAAIEFETAIEHTYVPDETVLRATNEVLRDEIDGVREDFSAHDLTPEAFVFPYDALDTRAWKLASESYETIPNGGVRPLPNPGGTPMTALRRGYLQTTHMTRTEIDGYLDCLAAIDGIGVLAGHSAWESVPRERIETVLRGASSRGIDVVTFRDLDR